MSIVSSGPKMMSIRSKAAVCIAVKAPPHIEPVLSITSASSMPVVSRSMTVRAPTVIVSWPKIRMNLVGVEARAVSVTNLPVPSS